MDGWMNGINYKAGGVGFESSGPLAGREGYGISRIHCQILEIKVRISLPLLLHLFTVTYTICLW